MHTPTVVLGHKCIFVFIFIGTDHDHFLYLFPDFLRAICRRSSSVVGLLIEHDVERLLGYLNFVVS
jgi:hypothetical protein